MSRLERFARHQTLDFYLVSVCREEKKFYNIDTRTPVEAKEPGEDDYDSEDHEVEVKNLQQVDPEWVMEHAKQGEAEAVYELI